MFCFYRACGYQYPCANFGILASQNHAPMVGMWESKATYLTTDWGVVGATDGDIRNGWNISLQYSQVVKWIGSNNLNWKTVDACITGVLVVVHGQQCLEHYDQSGVTSPRYVRGCCEEALLV